MKIVDLTFAYDTKKIVSNISFEIQTGSITAVLGANGSGKSTLFALLTKNLAQDAGSIYLEGRELSEIKLREFAKKVAVVHQQNVAEDSITVENLVSFGRLPYAKRLRGKSEEDEEVIRWAILVTGLEECRNSEIGKLSGGQRQRAFIAMALAQKTKILLLDEPTTFLDIRYQIEILELIKSLNQEYGITILMILHDVNQALAYSHNILGLRNGKLEVQGKAKEVITEESLHRLYGIRLKIGEIDGNRIVY